MATSDKGAIELLGDGLAFHGAKVTIAARPVTSVQLVGQRLPWPSYVVTTIACVAVLLMVGWPVAAVLVVTAVADLFGLKIGINTKWILVGFVDPFGLERQAYFADGSSRGWGGILGGTEQLRRRIEASLANPSQV